MEPGGRTGWHRPQCITHHIDLLGQVRVTNSVSILHGTQLLRFHRAITLLSFDFQRNYYCKNVVLFDEEDSILLLPEYHESSG